MKILLFIALTLLSSCNYTINLAHTEGVATDTIEDTSSASAKATVPVSLTP